jgi:thiol-disulfide isomerase/thioredoxin
MKKTILVTILLAGLIVWTFLNNGTSNAKKEVQNRNKENVVTTRKENNGEEELKAGISKGNLASEFELMSLDGSKARLSDFRGKKVLLNFWATWCPPCREEMPEMEKFHKDNKNNQVVILGVNLTTSEGSVSDVENYINQEGITFKILLDQEGQVGNIYRPISIPTTYFIDSDGVIRNKYTGPMSYEMMQDFMNAMN